MLRVKTTVHGDAINSLKAILILQPAYSDVKIGEAHAHGNRLIDAVSYRHIGEINLT